MCLEGVSAAAGKTTKDVSRMNRAFAALGGVISRSTYGMGRFQGGLVAAAGQMRLFQGGLTSIVAAVGLVTAALGVLGVSFNATLETLEIGFAAMLNSGSQAKDLIDRLIKTSANFSRKISYAGMPRSAS